LKWLSTWWRWIKTSHRDPAQRMHLLPDLLASLRLQLPFQRKQ
jgi:hypothetical protein